MARHIRLFTAAAAILLAAGCNRSAETPTPAAATGPVRGGSLTASIRSDPNTFNRFAPNGNQAAVDALTRLVHATLVRVDRVTGDVQPWLAERWTASPDGRTYTLTLRDGVTFSDGAPFTAADVLFTFQALYDPTVQSSLASGLMVQGKPLQVSSPDARTVVVTMPAPFAPGIALLDNLPILPKHQLQAALDSHAFAQAWGKTTPAGTMAGLGPFVISEFVPGQRLTFSRNTRYWRKDPAGAPLDPRPRCT